jgi:hypothetical protein
MTEALVAEEQREDSTAGEEREAEDERDHRQGKRNNPDDDAQVL